MELAKIESGMNVVDIGCGRGEIVLQCAIKRAKVWGIDYSREAVLLATGALGEVSDAEVQKRLGIQQADARRLPLEDDWADVIFMLDVVEHLLPDELETSLREARRVLKPGGKLIIHTMPNLWYYWFGYPLYRFVQRLRGEQLPSNPRERWTYSHVHVNEQTPPALKRVLESSPFKTRVWLRSTVNYDYEGNRWVRNSMQFLTRAYPFRLIFCNDIFAVGIKD
jgi:ubiquinone/menaquinone biosynthesis C-methylase UbiE